MPDWLNEPGEWASMLTIIVIILTGLTWLIRTETHTVRKQLTPNGGKSVSDKIDQLLVNQQDIRADVREMRAQITKHQDRLFDTVGKVHNRIDEHIAEDHLRRGV